MVLIGIDPYPYVPLGISHGRCPPLIVPYPPSKHVAKGSPWAPWAPKKREKRCGKSMRNQGTQTGSTRKFRKFRFGDFDGFCDCEKIWTFHQQNRNRDNLDLTHTCDLIHNDTSNIDMISICNHWDMMGIWLMNWLVVAGIFHVHLICILPSMMVLIEYFLRIGRTRMGCNKYTRTIHTYVFIHHIYIYIYTLHSMLYISYIHDIWIYICVYIHRQMVGGFKRLSFFVNPMNDFFNHSPMGMDLSPLTMCGEGCYPLAQVLSCSRASGMLWIWTCPWARGTWTVHC